jgi:hypothetical protein
MRRLRFSQPAPRADWHNKPIKAEDIVACVVRQQFYDNFSEYAVRALGDTLSQVANLTLKVLSLRRYY